MRRCYPLLCLLLIFALLLPFTGCAESAEASDSFYLMDTLITVTLYTTKTEAAPIFAECRARMQALDALWSRTEEGSDTSRWNDSDTGLSDLDPKTVALLSVGIDVALATKGAFDMTVAPAVLLWETCAAGDRLPTEEELTHIKAKVGSEQLKVLSETAVSKPEGVKIDLGGIGKGAAISELITYLKSTAVPGGIVSFGSNVAVFGQKPSAAPFRIVLRDPKDAAAYAGVITLADGEILSVSGDYERYHTIGGQTYHHILDPETLYPSASGLSSVAVICADGALADALSTALLVMGEEESLAFYSSGRYDFEAVLISADGHITLTDGMKAHFEAI